MTQDKVNSFLHTPSNRTHLRPNSSFDVPSLVAIDKGDVQLKTRIYLRWNNACPDGSLVDLLALILPDLSVFACFPLFFPELTE